MRLFVSIDLDGMTEALRTAQEPFTGIDGVRPVAPSQVHVTLKFLGEVDTAALDGVESALHEAIDDADVSPFEARFGGYGAFPSHDYISVIWIGVRAGEGDAEMARLHEAIEDRMVALGFDAEEHEFTPHATIARMDHAAGKSRVQTLLDERDPDVCSIRVTEVRLTESTLMPEGPEYETVAAVAL